MNSKELLLRLQEKTAHYDLDTLKRDYSVYQNNEFVIAADDYENMNRKYNLETLISLKENPGNFFAEPLNDRYISKFRDAINSYMDTYAPGNEELKNYIRQLNCYRTFILKIPMHPVGMSFPNGRVIQKGNQYYCTAKKFNMNQKDSLCRFCVAKISEL